MQVLGYRTQQPVISSRPNWKFIHKTSAMFKLSSKCSHTTSKSFATVQGL